MDKVDAEPTNLRILIIDDNPEIHKDFVKILSTRDAVKTEMTEFESKIFGSELNKDQTSLPKFIIDSASQGQEGAEKIAQALKENNPYALAFVDIRMPPGWDGIETIKHIWQIDPEIQIVICTAYSDYSWEETVEQLGQSENLLILKKPFDNIAVRQLSVALTKKWQLFHDSQNYTSTLERYVQERTVSLRESLSITRGALESSIDGIFVTNINGGLIDINLKLINMWNIPESILDHKSDKEIINHICSQLVNSNEFLKIFNELSEKPEIVSRSTLKDNNSRIFEHHSQPYALDGKTAGRVWSFRDITARSKLEEKVSYQATHDTLTGLPNRAMLMEFVQSEIKKAIKNNTKFALIFFDLDRFKLINDSFSHKVGDELLVAVAIRLKKSMRDVDFVARLGGDEFIGVVSYNKSDDDVMKITNKLISIFIPPFNIMGHEIDISLSMGISLFPAHGKNTDELLQHADMAMYRAKELGGNQIQPYTPLLNKINSDRLQLEADLHRAIRNNEFFLSYQPQYDISENKIVSVEALIRWQHPEKGLILPINFVPYAEELGLMTAIGSWVLKTACLQNKAWQDEGLPPIRIAVNISSQQFKQPDLVETIMRIVTESGMKPEYLDIELTENIIISSSVAAENIDKLHKYGISIALDDFGTGASSLNYLRLIKVDRLKIDKSFIENIAISHDDEVIIQAIITMAKSLNLEILAEGVETQEQLNFLKSKKCGEVQGFYFSKPLSSDKVRVLLKYPEKILSELPE